MTKVIFENMGVIDMRAVTTMGVSVKENDKPIGFFGTGIKYAIAILLRTGHRITIYAGNEKHEFAPKTVQIRGTDVEIVTMDGQELGFTTHMGSTWEMWMCYRELHCNCTDEGGNVFELDGDPVLAPYKTIIVVEGDEFLKAHCGRSSFILEGTPLFVGSEAEIYAGKTSAIFYRGIKVSDTPLSKDSQFTYNITRPIDLTEDRTVKYTFQIHQAVSKAITESCNKDWLREVLTSGDDTMEGNIDFTWAAGEPSNDFLQVVEELGHNKIAALSTSARQLFVKHTAKVVKPIAVEITQEERERIRRCVGFAKALGYDIDKYPIIVVEQLGATALAVAYGKQIHLSRAVFNVGNRLLAHALIEEFIHIDTGYSDEGREMQTHLFQEIVRLGEEHVLKEPV